MTKGIFITATGTDVGKTYISALIVKKLREDGLNCGYFKPALSGAEVINGELVPGDCKFVLDTAGIKGEPKDFASYIFKTAVSPHLASEIENKPINLEKIKKDFEIAKTKYDYIVVEGAGGIICPFNLGEDKIILPDVIKALDLDVVVVSSSSLGSINSAVLTTEYIKHQGINIKGIILNNYDENNFMEKDNKEKIEELSGYKVLTTVKKEGKDIINLANIFKEV